jgi:hypothetical protein
MENTLRLDELNLNELIFIIRGDVSLSKRSYKLPFGVALKSYA